MKGTKGSRQGQQHNLSISCPAKVIKNVAGTSSDNDSVGCQKLNIKTHRRANSKLVGTVVAIEDEKYASTRLVATQDMAVDDQGLVHGGFAFGLADLAAMVLVNQPNVVLASAEMRYLAPVKVGDEMVADASLVSKEENRFKVRVEVRVGDRSVAEGTFNCVVTGRHVLEKRRLP